MQEKSEKEKVNLNVKIKRKRESMGFQTGWRIAAVRLVQGERW